MTNMVTTNNNTSGMLLDDAKNPITVNEPVYFYTETEKKVFKTTYREIENNPNMKFLRESRKLFIYKNRNDIKLNK